MMDAVLMWVAEELPSYKFWGVYIDLTKLNLTVSTAAFQDAIKRYVSNDCDDLLLSAFEVCHNNEKKH